MKLKFLNNTHQNRKFDYNPRYYDERKERLAERKVKFERLESGEMSAEERRAILKESMRNEWSRAEFRDQQKRSSNLRILMLVGIIVALGYFIFFGIDQVDIVVERLW